MKMTHRIKNERGQGMVEYALIVALIAIVAIGALTPLGNAIRDAFNNIQNSFSGASNTSSGN